MEILKRKELIDEIIDCNWEDYVRLITGVAGVGKTTLIKGIMEELKDRGVCEENMAYVSFYSCEFRDAKDRFEVYKSISDRFNGVEGRIYLFFDDVEMFSQWQSVADSFRCRNNFEVYVAANYSKLYKTDGRNELAGRFIRFELYPFSFKEFVQFKKEIEKDERSAEELFLEYLLYGGMPDIISADVEFKFDFLKNLYRFIRFHNLVKDSDSDRFMAETFLEYMVNTFTAKFSKDDLEKYVFEFEDDVVGECLCNLKRSGFMLASKTAYDGRRLREDEKYYHADHGFFNALNGFNPYYIEELLENIIYVELLRRGYRVFFTESYEKYVDFICDDYNRKIFIQFDYMFLSENIIKKEMEFLNYHAGECEKYIITCSDYDFSEYGVKHLNIIDFLLGDEI